MPLSWQSSSYTHTGQVRSLNEDSLIELNNQSVWVVADGMGGHDSGDYASQLVVNQMQNLQPSRYSGIALSRMDAILEHCNSHLLDKADREQADVIGCTVCVLSMHDHHAVCTWSGDSRIYRIRNQALTQLTRDHSYQCFSDDRDVISQPEAVAGAGEMLTQAIGGDEFAVPDRCWYRVEAADRFLLCTDGLYKEVTDEEILDIVLTSSADQVLTRLAELYHQRGARDNVGMVFVIGAQ